MASPVSPPRGMRDFLPAEKRRREHVLAKIRRVYTAHGFDEIETPVMEDSARLHAGLGGDNEKLAFGVLKRGLTPDDLRAAADPLDLADLGLRFDLTVPLARFYASHRAELPTVFRSIQIAPVWRAERPQKGRYRQFVQCDIDIVGESGAIAEIELIAATIATLESLGLDGCSIRINDRRILTAMLTSLGFAESDHASIVITVDKLDKIGRGGVVAELAERGVDAGAIAALDDLLAAQTSDTGTARFGRESIARAVPADVDAGLIDELASLGAAIDALGSNVELVFDPFLVRGMGYYTGTIFEIAHPSSSSALGGGGRYDGMIGRFLGTPVPAAGFSIGFERIVDLLEADASDDRDSVALVADPDVDPARLVKLKTALIETGARVRLERKPRNVKPLFASLAAAGFASVATVTSSTETIADLELRPLA
ncbi:histidine--tRNA ligase [Marisediminicola sp. LYQ134]|uniref:histidine--tRNA ligase n=1 Tax=Marisediminicola sp. LYQ134 TaxID=3391061 RepID=UPI003983C1CE